MTTSKNLVRRTIFLVLTSLPASWTLAASNGKPFNDLEDQVDAIESQVSAIDTRVEILEFVTGAEPITLTLDCNDESINDLLAQFASYQGDITINVSGFCNERVVVDRNGITINGDGSATIDGGVESTGSGTNLFVNNLSINGNGSGVGWALLCWNGSRTTGSNLVIDGNFGVVASSIGLCDLTDSTITAVNSGVLANLSSQVLLRGGSVSNANTGLNARSNSNIWVAGSQATGSVVIANNNFGALAVAGGSFEFSSALIQNNDIGIEIGTGSVLNFEGFFGSSVIIDSNRLGIQFLNAAMIHLRDNANVEVINTTEYGLHCTGNAFFTVVGAGFQFSGNYLDNAACSY